VEWRNGGNCDTMEPGEKMLLGEWATSVRTQTRETLHKTLPGVVLPQWVRCGRKNCRCVRGELHGPYHYRFWRECGRLRKTYVPAANLERVRSLCEARRRERRELKAAWDAWRDLRAAIREVQP
jgi:hypothetical protein